MRLLLAAGAVPPFLADVVALVVAAALVAYVSQRLGLIPIVGFLLAGVLIGPHALGLVRDEAVVDAAAELGVLLLLFTIGIEFSLDQLARLRRLILVGGSLQVGGAVLAVTLLLLAFGVEARAALFTGFLVAMSSTTLILKTMGSLGRLEAPETRVALGVSLAQDLASIGMVLLLPALGGLGGSAAGVGWALAKAALIIVVVLVAARRVLPPVLEAIARTCAPELFLLAVLAICFGTAYLVGLAGVSLSLGAFLAGLVVSQSRFAAHALSEVLPLQILFSAAFFVSVGMLLDVGYLAAHAGTVALAVGAVVAIKLVTSAGAIRLAGAALPATAAASMLLAQIGEFGFVLERAGREAGLTPLGMGPDGGQAFIATTVVLMVLTPLATPLALRLAQRLAPPAGPAPPATEEVDTAAEVEAAAAHFAPLADHVVVAGYGSAARPLARALRDAGVPFVIATLSPDGALEAEAEGLPVLRGDYTKQHILDALGLRRARLLVVPDDTPAMARRVAAVARALAPDVRIVAAVPTAAEAPALAGAGADRAVALREEAVIGLMDEVLRPYGAAPDPLALRHDHYAALAAAPALAPPAPDALRAPAQTAPWIDTTRPVTLAPDPAAPCAHAGHVHPVTPGTPGCAECLSTGDRWVHLRVCMTCGHVGCCDSSPGRHATAHFHASGHPVVRSIEPNEAWGWCYVDRTAL